MTIVKSYNFGEWNSKAKISRSDKLSFKAFVTELSTIASFRIDLQVNPVSSAFDTLFTSVTLSSDSFTGGNNAWTTFSIPISSFPIRADWIDLNSETLPFANTLFYYGIRFVMAAPATFSTWKSSVSIDDIRIIGLNEKPIEFSRKTKMLSFDNPSDKNIGQMILTYKKDPQSTVDIDVYNNFGSRSRNEVIPSRVNKEIILLNNSTNVITVNNSNDYSVISSTKLSTTDYIFWQGQADNKYIYIADRGNNRNVKIKRDNLGVFVSSFGSYGSGSNNFNNVHQQTMSEDYLYFVDINNQRIKQHRLFDNTFIRQYGSLGFGTTNFHQPTGIAVDNSKIYVADEGNYRLMRLNISSMAFEISKDLPYNTVGETSLKVDENYLYSCYLKVNEADQTNSDVILEKRDKNSFELIQRTTIRPDGVSADAIYENMGDIALLGKYIFLVFMDNGDNPNLANYYVQKRLKEDFSLVSEYKTRNKITSVLADPFSYYPITENKRINIGTEGTYLQLRFYSDSLDNSFTLYNQSYLLKLKNLGY
jgi:hypothetical protein